MVPQDELEENTQDAQATEPAPEPATEPAPEPATGSAPEPASNPLTAALVAELDELCTHYPERRAALIPALHRCQEELGGWISPEIIEACADYFDLEPVEVYGVASFYPMFFLRPVGRRVVSVCRNISCDLRGATELVERVRSLTGADSNGTSADGAYYVETVECQGGCCDAPMMVVDGKYHENVALDDVARILEVKE